MKTLPVLVGLLAVSTAVAAPPDGSAPRAAPPKPDPTLIAVPSNTLGPGVPLWVQREQAEADARIARAEASYAEARAALARVEAQAAADRPDLYFYGQGAGYYGGVVVYGPHQPGLSRAIANRPVPRPVVRPSERARPPLKPRVDAGADDGYEDQGASARRVYVEASRPNIGPAIEAQQEAQRRFGANATPAVIEPQKQRDAAVIRIRKAPKSGQ